MGDNPEPNGAEDAGRPVTATPGCRRRAPASPSSAHWPLRRRRRWRAGRPARPSWCFAPAWSTVTPARRRPQSRVAVHRRGILGPHLAVLSLGGHDRRSVLPQEVRRHQRHQLGAVGSDHRRGHRCRKRRIKGGREHLSLAGGLGSLCRGGVHPPHIGGGRGRHRHRRRAQPRPSVSPEITD